MNKLSIAGLLVILAAAAAPAHAATDCSLEAKNFFEKLMATGNGKMSNDQIVEAARKGVRAYDSCKAGDAFTVHGVFDQIDGQKK